MINHEKIKKIKRRRRHNRQRTKIIGTKYRPRLSVFRSNNHISCQIIDDEDKKTLVFASDTEIKKSNTKKKKSELAFMVGEEIAKRSIKKGIKKIVFDKGWYKYHGRVRAVAEGARKGGLVF